MDFDLAFNGKYKLKKKQVTAIRDYCVKYHRNRDFKNYFVKYY